MALVSLNAVRKSFGSRLVLDGLDFLVEPRARVGVVGANGSGKSTLLRLLAALEEPDAGTRVARRGTVVSYLPQHPLGDERTPLETVRAARPDLAELDRELHRVAEQLGSPELAADLNRMARVLRRRGELVERWGAAGGPSLDGRARAMLLDVGLSEGDLGLPTSALSGGQRKLIALAACLAQEPDVLLLDEPEAHLDAVGRSLLERLLRTFDGAAVRRFKDWAHRVVDERHIKQARNKQRQIDRMEKVERPVLERRRIALQLRPHVRGGQRVFELRRLGVRFGDDVVLDEIDLTVVHGERVGFVGANGAGKSVLLKTVVGELEPTQGEVWVGPSIRVGYLAQDQETLDPELSPLETVRLAHACSEGEAVSLLMKFLFPYEQVRRPNRLLSGGERTRLQLLLLMLARPNLLVLDEPTNHLDIDSVEELEAALEAFDGTVCAISHDRYFLDRITDRTVEVREGRADAFEGGYSAWFERTQSAAA